MNKKTQVLLKSFLILALPTVIEQLLETIVQYVDTAMVGHLGPNATATVSVSSTYSWLINSVYAAIAIGFLAFVARAVGEKNSIKTKDASMWAIVLVIVLGLVGMIITVAIADFIPVWMGAAKDIQHNAGLYFKIINLPMVFRVAIILFGAIIRATGDTKNPMLINLVVNIVNIILNYIFIYALEFGPIGAGIASAISYVIGGILMTLLLLNNQYFKLKEVKIKEYNFNPVVLKKCLAVGIPVMFTNVASCLGYVVATSFVSSMSTLTYAAHSIAITAETIFYIPGYGMQAATATMIGNSIGENNPLKTRKTMEISIAVIFSVMCVTGTLLYVFAKPMMALFTNNQKVIEIGTGLLKMVAFTEPIFGTSAVMDGIYNGLAKTKYPLIVELIAMWGIRIMGSFVMVRILNKGITEVWYCMIANNIIKAILLMIGLVILVKKSKNLQLK